MKISKYNWIPLILRQSVAEATLEDERTIEISMCLTSGAFIGMIRDPKGKHIATYRIAPKDFINEMLACEDGKAEFEVLGKKEKET